jgi:hypothetical protein
MSSYIESKLFNDVFFFGINTPCLPEVMIGTSKSVNVLCANKYNILLFAMIGPMVAFAHVFSIGAFKKFIN